MKIPSSIKNTAAVSAPKNNGTAVNGEKEWTLLFYMNGRYGDLETSIAESFLEMEKVGSSDNMNIIAQIGRTAQGKVYNFGQLADLIDNDWVGVRRYLVKKEPEEQIALRESFEKREDYEAVVKQYPDNPLSHYLLGKYLEEHGCGADAKPCFAKAKELGILTLLGKVPKDKRDPKVKKNRRLFNIQIAKAAQNIRKKQAPYTKFASKKLKDFGIGSMYDAKTLKNFIKESMKAFPAKHYGLVMMAHGGAWMGTSNISPPKMQSAIMSGVKEANKETGADGKLDLVIFNSCYNGNLENMYQLAPAADIAIASEASALSSVFSHWGKLLDKFKEAVDAGSGQPENLANMFVNYYRDKNAKVGSMDDVSKTVHEGYNTVVSVKLKELKTMLGSLKEFDQVLNKNNVSPEKFFEHLRGSRNYPSDAYRFNFLDFYGDLRDLGDFLNRFKEDTNLPEEVRSAAIKAIDRLNDCKIAENHVSTLNGSTGLSIWAPDNALSFIEAKKEYKNMAPDFLKEVPWLERFQNAVKDVPLQKLAKAKQIKKRIEAMPPFQDPRLKLKVEESLKKLKTQLYFGNKTPLPSIAVEQTKK